MTDYRNKFGNSENKITIATTRPETILRDTALCVNPKDNRYKDFIGVSIRLCGMKW